MINRDEVFALMVPNGSAQSAATFEYVLSEQKVPLINAYGGGIEWYTPPRENLYGAYPLPEAQTKILGRWAAKDGHKNVVVVYGALASFEAFASHVAPGARSVRPDTNITLYPVKFGSTDYSPIALDLANKKPDALILLLVEQEVVSMVKELRQQNFRPQLYSWAPNVSNSLVNLAGPGMEGFKAVSYVVPPTIDTPAVREYRDAIAKYAPNEKPDYVSLTSFALTKIFVEAMRRIDGPITRQALTKSMDSLRNYDTGILPPVTYSPERHLGNSSLHRVQLVNGRWTAISAPVDPDKDWYSCAKGGARSVRVCYAGSSSSPFVTKNLRAMSSPSPANDCRNCS